MRADSGAKIQQRRTSSNTAAWGLRRRYRLALRLSAGSSLRPGCDEGGATWSDIFTIPFEGEGDGAMVRSIFWGER